MYTKTKNEILITDLKDFNINQIFDCGQIFRYFIVENLAYVVSKDKFAKIVILEDSVKILSEDVDYFEEFFDLSTDYSNIKKELKKDEYLRPCCDFGYGIRILRQDLFEMIVSFIISANNNIKRIKNLLNYLAKNFGKKIKLNSKIYLINSTDKEKDCGNIEMQEIEDKNLASDNPLIVKEDDEFYYYAFPTLEQFKTITIEDYVKAGLGYRASQMYDTIQRLNEEDIDSFYSLTFDEQMKFLLDLKGVGEKVANCIMLFTHASTRMFPVDTWINKVYNALTNTTNKSRKDINKELIDRYQDLSGYAQQYFFYYYRENKLQ